MADFGTFNAGYGAQIVLPAFDNLNAATTSFAAQVDTFATAPDEAGLEVLKNGFGDIADAWAASQQFRIGALAQEQRSERFAYWPERRNIVEKQLHSLLGVKGGEGLAAGEFAAGSVAIQGLPALERILFGEDDGRDLLKGDMSGRRRAVLAAIAHNLNAIAQETKSVWSANLKIPAKAASIFAANPEEGTAQSYTNLLTIMQIVAEQKTGATLGGADAASAKPKAAEQWRSGRSMRNILINLATARRSVLDNGGFAELLGVGRTDLKQSLAKAFDDAIAAAEAVGGNLPDAVSHPEKRKSVTDFLVKVNHLRDLLRQQVPPAIGITLGFNELDGDGS